VVGDKRKFPAVLIFPDFAALESIAGRENLQYASREELIALTPVRNWYGEIVTELNRRLAQFEKLKEHRLIVEELSATTGTMTASMKIRRRAIEERFQSKIDEIYGEHYV